jgi:hypothetical protein
MMSAVNINPNTNNNSQSQHLTNGGSPLAMQKLSQQPHILNNNYAHLASSIKTHSPSGNMGGAAQGVSSQNNFKQLSQQL